MKPELARPINMGLNILIAQRLAEPRALQAAELTQMREEIEDRVDSAVTGLADYVSAPGGWTESEMTEQHVIGAVMDLLLERQSTSCAAKSPRKGSKR